MQGQRALRHYAQCSPRSVAISVNHICTKSELFMQIEKTDTVDRMECQKVYT